LKSNARKERLNLEIRFKSELNETTLLKGRLKLVLDIRFIGIQNSNKTYIYRNLTLHEQITVYKKKRNKIFTFSQYLDTVETQLLHKIFRKAIRVSWIHRFLFIVDTSFTLCHLL